MYMCTYDQLKMDYFFLSKNFRHFPRLLSFSACLWSSNFWILTGAVGSWAHELLHIVTTDLKMLPDHETGICKKELFFKCVYGSICMCAHMFVEATESMWGIFLDCFSLSFWERVQRWTLWSLTQLTWLISKPRGLSCLCRPSTGITNAHCHAQLLLLVLESEIRPSRLCSKQFINWSISPLQDEREPFKRAISLHDN